METLIGEEVAKQGAKVLEKKYIPKITRFIVQSPEKVLQFTYKKTKTLLQHVGSIGKDSNY